MQTSVFSEHLAALLKHSLKLDADTGTGEDFIELQKLEKLVVVEWYHVLQKVTYSEYQIL